MMTSSGSDRDFEYYSSDIYWQRRGHWILLLTSFVNDTALRPLVAMTGTLDTFTGL